MLDIRALSPVETKVIERSLRAYLYNCQRINRFGPRPVDGYTIEQLTDTASRLLAEIPTPETLKDRAKQELLRGLEGPVPAGSDELRYLLAKFVRAI